MKRLSSIIGLCAAALIVWIAPARSEFLKSTDTSRPVLNLPWIDLTDFSASQSKTPISFQNVGSRQAAFRVQPVVHQVPKREASFSLVNRAVAPAANDASFSSSVSLKNGKTIGVQPAINAGDGTLSWVPVAGKASKDVGVTGTLSVLNLDLDESAITLTSHVVGRAGLIGGFFAPASAATAILTHSASPLKQVVGNAAKQVVGNAALNVGGGVGIGPLGPAAVNPEPSSLLLGILGGIGMLAYARRPRLRTA